MKPKILITLNGGLVTQVATNLPRCEVVIVDFDLNAQEDWPVLVSPQREQDATFEDGKAYLLFDANSNQEGEASDELKRIKY